MLEGRNSKGKKVNLGLSRLSAGSDLDADAAGADAIKAAGRHVGYI